MDATRNVLPELPVVWLIAAGVAAVLLVCLFLVVLFALFRGKKARPDATKPDLRVDVAKLPKSGPPDAGPQLTVYGTPVRLVAIILAPAGRHAQIPDAAGLPSIVNDLIPELAAVVESHRPILRRWPFQLSTQGFVHSFFNNAPLPGDQGKGTIWCSAAGRFESGQQQYLAGLVFTADKPNSLGQIAIEHTGQWMDVLRVKAG